MTHLLQHSHTSWFFSKQLHQLETKHFNIGAYGNIFIQPITEAEGWIKGEGDGREWEFMNVSYWKRKTNLNRNTAKISFTAITTEQRELNFTLMDPCWFRSYLVCTTSEFWMGTDFPWFRAPGNTFTGQICCLYWLWELKLWLRSGILARDFPLVTIMRFLTA